MICSLKQSQFLGCNPNLKRNPLAQLSVSPSISIPKMSKVSAISVSKPLHLSSIETFGLQKRKYLVTCKAHDADKSEGEGVIEKAEAARKLKIGFYFATWWFLNVIFNIYNKKVLNAFPFPWLTSTLSLAAGSLIMLVSWATKVAEAPKTDLDFWKSLFPVSNLGFNFHYVLLF